MPQHKLELVQVTPINHFQANERGATLRGSELKPKLDKYLIHAAFGDKWESYCSMVVGAGSAAKENAFEGKKALDYRVRIEAPTGSNAFPLTYVNHKQRVTPIGSLWDEPKNGTFVRPPSKITVHFLSKHEGLIAAIREWSDAFFASTNFGGRQSKGFGSFLTDGTAKSSVAFENALRKHISISECFQGKTNVGIPWTTMSYVNPRYGSEPYDKGWKHALSDICDLACVIKSGVNRGEKHYIPSYLMKTYAKNRGQLKDFDNEKKKMKTDLLQKLPEVDIPHDINERGFHTGGVYRYDGQPTDSIKREGRFLRAMLGLSSYVEFSRIRIGGTEQSDPIRVNITSTAISRFKNPITFKPVYIQGEGWRYYLIPNKIPDEMYNALFSFHVAGVDAPLCLSTPKNRDEFDLLDFLHCFSSACMRIRCFPSWTPSFKEVRPNA